MKSVFALVAATIMTSASICSAQEKPIKILVGGTGLQKVLLEQKTEIEKAAGAPVEVTISPNDVAIVPFIKGFVDMTATGSNLAGVLALAEAKGLAKQNPADFDVAEVTRVIVKIGVHPSNPVKSLSKQQVTDILTGKIKSWEPITGDKKPIKAIIARSYIVAAKAIADTYTSGEQSPVAQFVVDKEGVLRTMAKEPGAIGFFNEKDKMPGFEPKFFDSDASFSTYLVIKKDARPAAKKAFEYFAAKKR